MDFFIHENTVRITSSPDVQLVKEKKYTSSFKPPNYTICRRNLYSSEKFIVWRVSAKQAI